MNNLAKILLTIDLVVVNILVGWFFYNTQYSKLNVQSTTSEYNNISTSEMDELRGMVGQLTNRVGSLELTPYPTAVVIPSQAITKTVTVVAPTKTVGKTTTYVNIPGSGESSSLSWSDISGTDFYFDKADYPGLLSVVMEGSMKLFNGNGIGYVRLFDVTHGIAVVGSEVNTSSQADTLVTSGTLNLWSGKNLYRIQGKGSSTDRVIYAWAKLEITTQN